MNVDFSNNPVTDCERYRQKVFTLVPQIEVLDCLDKEGNEVNSEND